MIATIYRPLVLLLQGCYTLFPPYILSIVIFTVLTKVILLPITLWMHRNTLKMVSLIPDLNRLKATYYGDKERIAEETQKLYQKVGYHPLTSLIPMSIQIILLGGVINAVRTILGGSNSVWTFIPYQMKGSTYLMPVVAGLAALTLGVSQNHLNPLQREQAKAEQIITNGLSVAISLFLGAFVPLGVGAYWVVSNLLSIPQQILVNILIRPEKYVDYTALRESQRELSGMNSLSIGQTKEDRSREKVDYRRFFSIVNKHLVFYSEKSGFYKYFQNVIEYLLTHSNIVIHYVTNDPNDQIFQLAEGQPRIKPYYIGQKKLITLMMKMDADIVVMTTPDLENFYLKRSYVRNDIEYIYMFHGMDSTNMCARKGAYDHFDTIFCVGQHQIDELRETEQMYYLPPKNLIPCGYGLLENTIKNYKIHLDSCSTERKKILIAPSYQSGNILESCIQPLLMQLCQKEYIVTVRPHPEFVKRFPNMIESLRNTLQVVCGQAVIWETDFSSNTSVFTADLVITDWSSIAHEYAYTTKKPVLFINTPMKVLNPEYVRYQNQPVDITLRNQIGQSIELNEIEQAGKYVADLFAHSEEYSEKIEKIVHQYIFSLGHSGENGGKYILKQLIGGQHNGEQ